MSFLATQRQELILKELRTHGAARVIDLAAKLGVTDMTVRRDLKVLVGLGLVEKIHGGAIAIGTPVSRQQGSVAAAGGQLAEKQAIARVAAGLVPPGSAIGLSAGTTAVALALALAEVPNLTAVTNSVPVAEALCQANRPDRTVMLTGGVLTSPQVLVGPVAVATLRSLNLDAVFLGVHGIAAAAGFTTSNLAEATIAQALVHAGKRLIVVADHTKWGVVGISTIAELGAADVLVTDASLAKTTSNFLSTEIDELILAKLDANETTEPAAPRLT